MKIREMLGSLVTKIGMIMLKMGAIVTNAGFDLSNISRERAVEVMSKLWAEDLRKETQVVKHDHILDKDYAAFVRSGAKTEMEDRL